MRAKIVVREGETLEQALKRFRREVVKDRAFDKWPKWRGHYAKPSTIRHRKRWIQAMKQKWFLVYEAKHARHSG